MWNDLYQGFLVLKAIIIIHTNHTIFFYKAIIIIIHTNHTIFFHWQ